MNQEVLELYKKKLVEIMEFFDKFCHINNLSYFACSGTAIGAVRHKGFIPWDDDIDLFMPRKDYNFLMENRNELLSKGYAIKNLGDEDYIYSYAKLYDINTTLIESSLYPNCNIGVYIDIFPLDEVSGTFDQIRDKKQKYTKEYRLFQDTYLSISGRLLLSCAYHCDFKRLKELIIMSFTSNKKKQLIRDNFCLLESTWAEEKGSLLMTHSCIYSLEKELFPKKWFSEGVYKNFENIKIRISNEYDAYLQQLYGDYMSLPPVEKRVSNHSHYYLNLKEGLPLKIVHERIAKGETIVY